MKRLLQVKRLELNADDALKSSSTISSSLPAGAGSDAGPLRDEDAREATSEAPQTKGMSLRTAH